MTEPMRNKASFSACRKYRYTLWRMWNDGLFPGPGRYVNFLCLNPSTADDEKDDNTIRKCRKLAKAWGYDGMCVTNLFAWRDTFPANMKKVPEPIGDPANLEAILRIAAGASLIICAWGMHGIHRDRANFIRSQLQDFQLHYLKITDGEPHHPLYQKDSSLPIFWEAQNV